MRSKNYVLSCSSGSHHDLKIPFNLNDYFSFPTTTLDSVIEKFQANWNKNYSYEFYLKTLHIFIQIEDGKMEKWKNSRWWKSKSHIKVASY
jgi:hypothetical protein